MHGIDVTPDASLAARLKRDAERSPAAYRARLALLALIGDTTLTIAQVLPIALPIALGVLWANHPFFYVVGIVAVVFVAWLVRPQARFTGRPITPQEAPALFAALDALRTKLDVPGRMEVLVDEDFNASAGETGGFLGLGKRRVLTLGMPLLVTLTREQLLGVIAHEFGHFSRRHGRFGHWLYRARAGWLDYLRQVDQSTSPIEQVAAIFAHRFVPFFSVRSFIHSRMCEYEADRDGALAVGAPAMAEALARIAVLARIWHEGVPRELTRLQQESPEPPQDLYGHFAAAAAAWPAASQRRWLDEALAMPSGWADTHPALAERLGSIQQEARATAARDPANCAGRALLGDAWAGLLAELNEKWLARVRPEWLVLHLRLRHVVQPLIEAAEAHPPPALPERLALARAWRWVEPDRGLAALRALHAEFADDPDVQYALGAALLNEDDDSGVALLEPLATAYPTFRMPAYVRLAGYYSRRNDKERADQSLEHLELSVRRRSDAVAPFWGNVSRNEAKPASLAPEALAVMQEAIARDKCISQAWMMEGTAALATAANPSAAQLVVHGLVLQIRTEEMSGGVTENGLAEHYEWSLSTLVPPNHHAAVMTYLTTEPERSFDDRFRLGYRP